MSQLARSASSIRFTSTADTPLDQAAARWLKGRQWAFAVTVLWFAAAVSPHWIPTNDSAMYLMLGRNLARGEGYTLSGQPHVFVPPGYPVLIAALDRCGLGSMLCLNIAMAICGLLVVWLSYLLVSRIASKPVAVLVASAVGLNSALHAVSARQLSDVPFALLVLIGLASLLRGREGTKGWLLELGTLAIVASCWIRLTGLALAAGCAVGLLLERRNVSRLRVSANALALLAVVGGSAAMFYVRYLHCRQADGSFPPASYFASIEPALAQPFQFWLWGPLENSYKSAVELSRYLTGQELHAVVAGILFVLPIGLAFCKRLAGGEYLLPAALLAYVCGVVLILPATDRYLVPFGALLTLYFLEGIGILLRWRPDLRAAAPRTLLVLFMALIAFNAIKGVGGLRRNRDTIARRHAELDRPVVLLQSAARQGEQFLSTERERELAYLSDVPAVQYDRPAMLAKMSPPQYFRFLFDHGVRLIVAAPECSLSMPDARLVLDAVRDRRMFAPIGGNGRYCVYRFQAPPSVALAAAASAN